MSLEAAMRQKDSPEEAERYVGRINEAEARLASTPRHSQSNVERAQLSFERVTEGNLAEGQAIVGEVFPHPRDNSVRDLADSIGMMEKGDTHLHAEEINKNYWLAKGASGEYLGITGLYDVAGDKESHCWLGWFALKPGVQGGGLGKTLLDGTIDKARAMGKTDLYVISSDRADMVGNAKFYHLNDCPVIGVLNRSGTYLTQAAHELPQSVIRGIKAGYQIGIDNGLNIYIRRRHIAESVSTNGH